jgi:type IV pilus assembly protein PilN
VFIEINLAPGLQARRPFAGGLPIRLPALPALGTDPRIAAASALAALLVVLAVLSFVGLGTRAEAARAQIEREVADSARYATTIALINSLEARQDTIQRQIGVIRSVDQRRYVWPHLLDEISLSVPAYTWLTQVSTLASPDSVPGPALSIQGNAGSTQSLTRFMKNLEASPFIRDVTLLTSEQDVVERRTIHRFTLEARYEDPDPVLIATVPIIAPEGGR